MFRNSCLIVFLLLAFIGVQSQAYHKQPAYLESYRKAEQWFHAENPSSITDSLSIDAYQRCIDQLNFQHIINSILLDCYLKTGILQMTAARNDAARRNFQQAIAAYAVSKQLPDSLLFLPYLYIGSIQYDLNNLDSAIFYYKKAEAINSHYPGLNESERLYNKLGALYYETGDYQRSIPYYEKALTMAAAKRPVNLNLVVTYKNNIASSFLKLGNYEQALFLYRQLLTYHFNEDQLYMNIGIAYLQQGDASKAVEFLKRAKQNTILKYNNLSRAFLALKKVDSAAYYNRFALEGLKSAAVHTTDNALAFKYAGDISLANGKPMAAIRSYQSALLLAVPGFADTIPAHNPHRYKGLPNFSIVFDILLAKAIAFKQMQGSENRKSGLDACTAALSLSQQVEKMYSTDDARLFLKGKVSIAVGEAVGLALGLYSQTKEHEYLSKAFSFIETSKASVLQNGIRQLALTAVAGLPADLLQAEKKYKTLIAKLSIAASRLHDSAAVSMIQRNIQNTALQLSLAQEKLDDNAVYHRLKFNTPDTNIDSIRHRLGKDAAMLSYFYTADQLLCFYITNDNSGCNVVKMPADFISTIRQMHRSLQAPEETGSASDKSLLRKLYQWLIAPVLENIHHKQQLIIVPFNETCYLPFEALQNPDDGAFLLTKFDISYQYAAGFLADEHPGTSSKKYEVLAMAPFASQSGNASLPPLPNSAAEIKGLAGAIFTDAAATRSRFINEAGRFEIIHLATHAQASDEDPLAGYIEFFAQQNAADSTHRLYEKEIYNLDMKAAKLVILSACETGKGILVNGEGIVSLSRAFSYAGCKSVITSLWKADDASTAYIMKKLHGYLQKGYNKSEALQKAKLDYLNDPSVEDRYKRPAYWAHLVLIGNADPVTAASQYWNAWWLCAIALVIAAAIYFKKRAH